MHDINFIRENPETFDELLRKRFIEPKSNIIISLDTKKRSILTKSQELRANRKTLSSSFSNLNDIDKIELQKKVQLIKNQIDELEKDIFNIDEQLKNTLSGLPNLPHSDVPVGEDENTNKLIKQVGIIPSFKFSPKSHYELGENLEMIDFEQAGKVSGTRFVYLKKKYSQIRKSYS